MAHIINKYVCSNDFLKECSYNSLNPQKWNNAILRMAAMNSKKPLPEPLNNPTKQAFVMAQTQSIIRGVEGGLQNNILAVLNPELGSLRMKERLGSNSFWYELSAAHNRPPFHIAEAVCLTLLNIDPLSCYQTTPADTLPLPPFQQNKLSVERTIIPEFIYGNEVYLKKGEDTFLDYNGEIRSIVNIFTNHSQNIYVFENRISLYCGDFLCIGRSFLPNYPIGHEYLYNLPTLPCLVFAVSDVGFEFRQIYREAGEFASSKFHALTFYGNMKNMSFSELTGRDIILICSPDRQEWDNIHELLKICRKFGVKSVAIYPFPIVGKFCHFGDRQISEESRTMLEQEIIDLSKIERITITANCIIHNAIPEHGFKNFLNEYKLTTDGKDLISTDYHKIEFRPWYEFDNEDIYNSRKIKTRQFFSSENTTLVYGPSDIGKSWFTMQIAVSLAAGREFLDFEASQPAKVLYLDGEVGNAFASRIRQLSKDFDEHEMELLNQNLQVFAFAESKELLERSEEILNTFKEERIHVVLIDNILSLAPESWRGRSDCFFEFLRKLKSIGIAPIIVHHTSKKGDAYLGSASLGSLCQNILKLESGRGTTSSMPDTEKSRLCVGSETLSEAETGKGPFVRVLLEKTKVAPYWRDESILVWLPIDKSWQQLTKWPEIPCLAEIHEEVDAVIGAAVEKQLVSLPPDERKVAKFIFSNPGGVKRKDLDEKFGWGEQTSMKVINKLKDNGYVVSEGAGKGCIYKPKS